MNELVATLGRWFGQLTFWIAVAPWEQVLRVRCGRHVRVLRTGFYPRIPLLDVVYRQSVRLRFSIVATQTLSTKDGATVVVGAALGYAVADILALYKGLHHAEDSLRSIAAAAIADYVRSVEKVSLRPGELTDVATRCLAGSLAEYGLTDVTVRLTDFAFIRAYRILQDGRWQAHSDDLDTNKGVGA